MKKVISAFILSTISIFSSLVLAGGVEMLPPPPAPMDMPFDGFNIGAEGVFWYADFGLFGEGEFACRSCIHALGSPAINLNDNFAATYLNDGHATEADGAGGLQLTFGRVIHGMFLDYYVGVRGFIDFGDVDAQMHSASRDLKAVLAYTHTSPQTAPIPFDVDVPGFKVFPGDIDLRTHADFENIYGVNAKLGYLLSPVSMAYLTIGAAWSEITVDNSLTTFIFFPDLTASGRGGIAGADFYTADNSATDTEIGLLVGFGLEHYFTRNMTINIEYNYIDFGRVSADRGDLTTLGNILTNDLVSPVDAFLGQTTLQSTRANTDLVVNSVRVGLNYYFNL